MTMHSINQHIYLHYLLTYTWTTRHWAYRLQVCDHTVQSVELVCGNDTLVRRSKRFGYI